MKILEIPVGMGSGGGAPLGRMGQCLSWLHRAFVRLPFLPLPAAWCGGEQTSLDGSSTFSPLSMQIPHTPRLLLLNSRDLNSDLLYLMFRDDYTNQLDHIR
ncbi:hypothetical protein V6N12_013271 [Hibiscus sabdariffa]|uniref:Uncharacterized protein n=1 Tax=Hibiscus sabdariffa TaxID=183260 RepID=A0ABR2D6X5_9ROSI